MYGEFSGASSVKCLEMVAYHAIHWSCDSVVIVSCTVVPVMNGHPWDQAKVSVHCRWPLIRGNLTLKCVDRGIDNVAVQGRWPFTTGVAQGRYYCMYVIT